MSGVIYRGYIFGPSSNNRTPNPPHAMKVSTTPYNSLHVDVYRHMGQQPHATVAAFIPGCQLFIHDWTAPKLLEAAKGFVNAVDELDPDNSDKLIAAWIADIRANRTPRPVAKTAANTTSDPEVEYVAAGYRDGLVPTCDEDTTLDVCNAREDVFNAIANATRPR